ARAVNESGFVELSWQRQKELAHQEDRKSAPTKPGWNPQRIQGVDPSEVVKQNVPRNQGNLGGKHHCRQGHHENRVLEAKVEAGEPVGDHGARNNRSERREDHNLERVAIPQCERERGERFDEVKWSWMGRNNDRWKEVHLLR